MKIQIDFDENPCDSKSNHKVHLHIKCMILVITQTHSTQHSYGMCNFSLEMPTTKNIESADMCECGCAPTHAQAHTQMLVHDVVKVRTKKKTFSNKFDFFSPILLLVFSHTLARVLLLQILENNKRKNGT